jgi:exosome complex RNA-binding protein Rrp4
MFKKTWYFIQFINIGISTWEVDVNKKYKEVLNVIDTHVS